jgi:hypothetical protein
LSADDAETVDAVKVGEIDLVDRTVAFLLLRQSARRLATVSDLARIRAALCTTTQRFVEEGMQ